MREMTNLKPKFYTGIEPKDLIYSDRFVKITNEDQIVMGTGFESDPRLIRRKIKKVSATIYLKDEVIVHCLCRYRVKTQREKKELYL